MTPARRFLGGLGLVAALALTPADAKAQQPPPPGEPVEETDNSLYGYVGTGLFAAMAMFAICKSARR